MTFTEPQPFEEALQKLDERQIALSPLRSREWREKVPTALRDRAFFSSTLENARVAQAMKDFIADFLAKAIDPATGGLKAQGRAEFVADLRALCIREGLGKLDPETGQIAPEIDETDLTDLRSMARLQLIFDTQTTAAHEYGYWAQGNDPDILYAYPAQRFIRVRPVRTPRPLHAANEGQVRRKDDINFWLAMNPDFGVPYGPWGFNSGMGVEDVDRIEAEDLGLLAPGQEIDPPDRLLNDTLSAGIRDIDPDIRAELLQIFGPQIRQVGDRLQWTGNISDYTPAPFTPITPQQRIIQSITRRVAKATTREKAHTILTLKKSDRGTLSVATMPSDPQTAQIAEEATHFTEHIVHKDYFAIPSIHIQEDTRPNPRGYYLSWLKTAFISKDIGRAVHEIMHHLEHENPALYKAAKAFRKSRAKGETAQKLSVLTGNPNYDDGEVAYKDKWAERGGDHYCGKEYNEESHATEILTMGIERLFNDPIGFAKDDPDYFQFLIRTLQKL